MFTDNITLGIPYTTREVNFKSLVSGTDTIKACTLIYCVVAATGIILQDLVYNILVMTTFTCYVCCN